MISLVIAESSLELVPKNIQNHPAIISHARKLGKNTSEILLDNSWHFAAMKGIENEIKRGRPDLVHFCLLEACTIPLFFENKLQIFIHTINNKVIRVHEQVNIPKSYHRFAGLVEQLFFEKLIHGDGRTLLDIHDMSLSELLEKIKPSKVIGVSVKGNKSSYQEVAQKFEDNSCLVVGGFQKGHFSETTKNCLNELYSVDIKSLEAHVVISRILYEYEKTIFM